MVEAHHEELPDGPPSPLQKALAGWELSEQQGETQALSLRGQTLKKGEYYNAFCLEKIYCYCICHLKSKRQLLKKKKKKCTWHRVLLQLLKSFSNSLIFFTQASGWYMACFAVPIASMCQRLCWLSLLFSLKCGNPSMEETWTLDVMKLLCWQSVSFFLICHILTFCNFQEETIFQCHWKIPH